jgi:cell division protein FtsQ
MAEKRRISIRKILQAFVTLVVTSGCIVAVWGASRQQQLKTVSNIELNVTNGGRYQFLDKQALWKDVVDAKGIKENKTRVTKLNIKAIEKAAYRNPWVSKAQAYVDNQQQVHINVTQRVPVARIYFQSGQSFYLDRSLNLLPLSEMFTYYTTIVTNVPYTGNDSTDKALRGQIVDLVHFINKDTFWSAQIDQVIVNEDQTFELIPVLGTHKILLGDTSRMREKFSGLFSFYKNVLNRIGWDKYETLDLNYKDQVVASPALPWKLPSKNAISNMDWLKNIMEGVPKDSTKVVVAAVTKPEPAKAETKKKDVVVKKKEPATVTAQAKPENTSKTGKYIYHGNTTN